MAELFTYKVLIEHYFTSLDYPLFPNLNPDRPRMNSYPAQVDVISDSCAVYHISFSKPFKPESSP